MPDSTTPTDLLSPQWAQNLLAQSNITLSPESQQHLFAILDKHRADLEGTSFTGMAANFGGMAMKWVECIFGLLTGKFSSFQQAMQSASFTANNDTHYDTTQQAAARLAIDLTYSGDPALASIAPLISGEAQVHDNRATLPQTNGQDATSILLAAHGLTKPVHDGLNLNPAFQQPQVAIDIAPPGYTPPTTPGLTGAYGVA